MTSFWACKWPQPISCKNWATGTIHMSPSWTHSRSIADIRSRISMGCLHFNKNRFSVSRDVISGYI